jgi:hypothetical protein
MLYNNNILNSNILNKFLNNRFSLEDCIFYYKQNPLFLLNFFGFLLKLKFNYKFKILNNILRLVFFGFFVIIYFKKFSFLWYSFFLKKKIIYFKKFSFLKSGNFLYFFNNIFNKDNVLKFNKFLTFKEVYIKELEEKKLREKKLKNNYRGNLYNNYRKNWWYKDDKDQIIDKDLQIIKIFGRFFSSNIYDKNKNIFIMKKVNSKLKSKSKSKYSNTFNFKDFDFTKMTSSLEVCLEVFLKKNEDKFKEFIKILKEFLNWDLDPLKILNFFKIFKVISISNPRKIDNFIEYLDTFILSLPYYKRFLFFYLKTVRIDNLTKLYHIIKSFNRFLDMIHHVKDDYENIKVLRKNVLILQKYIFKYIKIAKVKNFNLNFLKNLFLYCINLSEDMFLKKNKIYLRKDRLKISLLTFFNKNLVKKIKLYLKSFCNNFFYSKIRKLFFHNFEFFLLFFIYFKFKNYNISNLNKQSFSFKLKKNFLKVIIKRFKIVDNLNFKSFLWKIKSILNPNVIFNRTVKNDKEKYYLSFIKVFKFIIYFYSSFEFFLFWFLFFNKYFLIFFGKIFINFWVKIFYNLSINYNYEIKNFFNIIKNLFEYRLNNKFFIYGKFIIRLHHMIYSDMSEFLILSNYLNFFNLNYDYRKFKDL